MEKPQAMKNVFIMLFLLISSLFSVISQAATIRISSPRVELELAPGESYSGEIVAENPTEEEMKAKIYLEDWIYSPGGTGEKKFTPVATTPLSASKWVTFSPSDATVKPFGRATAR